MSSNAPAILNTGGEGTPPNPSVKYVVCDNCKCSLTVPHLSEPGGQVFKISPEAIELRDYRETTKKELARKDEEITNLNARIVELQSEIRRLQPPEPAKKSGFHF